MSLIEEFERTYLKKDNRSGKITFRVYTESRHISELVTLSILNDRATANKARWKKPIITTLTIVGMLGIADFLQLPVKMREDILKDLKSKVI